MTNTDTQKTAINEIKKSIQKKNVTLEEAAYIAGLSARQFIRYLGCHCKNDLPIECVVELRRANLITDQEVKQYADQMIEPLRQVARFKAKRKLSVGALSWLSKSEIFLNHHDSTHLSRPQDNHGKQELFRN